MRKVRDILWTTGSYGLAVVAACFPLRWWRHMDRTIPVSRCAIASGIATLVVGASIGIPGYLSHVQGNTGRGAEMIVQAGRWKASPDPIPTDQEAAAVLNVAYLSPLTFLFTPVGILFVYLSASGLVRAVSGYVDDPRGDPILTLADLIVYRQRRKAAAQRMIRAREELEGSEVPDRLVTGRAAGFPDADFVIVASRRKPGWERGVFVITPDVWYRLGTPTEMTLRGGLRTLYPLTEIRDLEVVRKRVEYVLPPLSGSMPPPAERVDA